MRVIQQLIVVLLMGGLFGVPPVFAQRVSDWVGVWRLSFGQSDEAGTIHWVLSEDQGKFSAKQYSDTWRSGTVTVKEVDSSKLVISSQFSGYKVSATVTRQGDQFSGIWKLVHAQFSADKPVTGLRVVKANHWEPLEGIRKIQDASGLADVSSALKKAAVAKDLKAFTAAWDTDIGATYYLFLQDFWDPDPARKSQKLGSLYRLLKSKSFEANVKTTAALRNEIVNLIKAKQPDYYFSNPTVIVPTLSSADVRVIDVVDGKVYVKAEVPEKPSAPPAKARLKWLFAREHLEMAFLTKFPLQVRVLPIELVRKGVASYMAADLVGVSLPDILATSPAKAEEFAGRLDFYRKGLAAVGNSEPEDIGRKFADDPLKPRQILDMVGYKFGQQVATRFTPAELLKLDRGRLLELAENFLKSGS